MGILISTQTNQPINQAESILIGIDVLYESMNDKSGQLEINYDAMAALMAG